MPTTTRFLQFPKPDRVAKLTTNQEHTAGHETKAAAADTATTSLESLPART